MIRSILLKALENIFISMLSLAPKYFIPAVKGFSTTEDKVIVFSFPILIFILTGLRYFSREHSNKFNNQCAARLGQILRIMVWKKLQRANIIFMKDTDEGIIIRAILFNLTILLGFVVNIPSFFSFPMIVTFAIIFFGFNIGLSTISLFGVFLITFLFLLLLTK